MAAMKQTRRGKRQRQRHEANRFLWHLEPEWRDKFSHRHWWNPGKELVAREAAYWELYRRHPSVSAVRAEIEPILTRSPGKQNVEVLARFSTALASWANRDWNQLGEGERRLWGLFLNNEVASQRGFTPSPVQVLSEKYPWVNWVPKEAGEDPDKLLRRVKASCLKNAALAAARKGSIVLAIDPSARGVGKLVEELVAKWPVCKKTKGGKPKSNGKSRINAWLNIIAQFEEAELERGKAQKRDDQLAVQYRRTIRALEWPS